MRPVSVLYVRSADRGRESWETLLTLLGDVTPVVEVLPPDAALADVGGSRRYFGRDAVELAKMVRVRALAQYGLECVIGVAAGPLLARTAAYGAAPGEVRCVAEDPDEAAAFLAPMPVAALYGVGPKTAGMLRTYGLDTAGKVAGVPELVVQRILGVRTGRLVHERARGIDRASVVPNAPARSAGAEHRFDRYELDAEERRRALLALADDIGRRLRADEQVARAVTLVVRYADRTNTTRTRTLAEPTAHTPSLAGPAYELHDALGLQRARVAALTLRAEDLRSAETAAHQLTFDQQEADARRVEPVVDRIAARWPGVVGPASAVALRPRPAAGRWRRGRPAGGRNGDEGRDAA